MGIARWLMDVLTLLSMARLRGDNVGPIDKLAREIRANAAAIGRVIPHDIMFKAAALLKADEEAMASDVGPEEEERRR